MFKAKEREISSHSLIFLASKVKAPNKFYPFLKKLNPQYTLTRYPDAAEEKPSLLYDKEDADFFIKNSGELLKWIENQLK